MAKRFLGGDDVRDEALLRSTSRLSVGVDEGINQLTTLGWSVSDAFICCGCDLFLPSTGGLSRALVAWQRGQLETWQLKMLEVGCRRCRAQMTEAMALLKSGSCISTGITIAVGYDC